MAINKAIIQGRLTKDVELRSTAAGKSVAGFRIAWSERYKETENKLFLDCVAWGGTAEFISRNFRKGQELVVEGKLGTREWEDNNGNKRVSIELTVGEVHFCGPKQDGQAAVAPVSVGYAEIEDDGELPF